MFFFFKRLFYPPHGWQSGCLVVGDFRGGNHRGPTRVMNSVLVVFSFVGLGVQKREALLGSSFHEDCKLYLLTY